MRCPKCGNPVSTSGGGPCEHAGVSEAKIVECTCGWGECTGFDSSICPFVCPISIADNMAKGKN